MSDQSISLVQLETFVTVAESGSFSAAARSMGKAQSAVSHAIHQLEKSIALELFDRSGRIPQLTEAGLSLVSEARDILRRTAHFQDSAQQWSKTAAETSFSLVVDMIYPIDPLVRLIASMKVEFPSLQLTVHTEARGAVTARVLDESGQLGVTGLLLPSVPTGIEILPLGAIEVVAVVSPHHPLARKQSPVPVRELRHYTQLVLEDRSQLSTDHQVGVVGANNWKIGSQETKHRFLLEGFGWGAMPLHKVADDLSAGRLHSFQPATWNAAKISLPLYIIHRSDRPPGTVAQKAIAILQQAQALLD